MHIKRKKRLMGVKRISISIPEELWKRAKKYAETEGVTVSRQVRIALEKFLKEKENDRK